MIPVNMDAIFAGLCGPPVMVLNFG
jgi:hypothetical protein